MLPVGIVVVTILFLGAVCHRDPAVGKYGLENALLPVGTNFLEVVAPVEANTAAGGVRWDLEAGRYARRDE